LSYADLFTAKQNEVGSVGMDSEAVDVGDKVQGIHHLNCKEDECARKNSKIFVSLRDHILTEYRQ
jgi:hypothetical protein